MCICTDEQIKFTDLENVKFFRVLILEEDGLGLFLYARRLYVCVERHHDLL